MRVRSLGGRSGIRLETVLMVVLVFALLLPWTIPGALAGIHTVNSTADDVDFDGGVGVCETASGNGICTLRAAIQTANTQAGADTIIFDIPDTADAAARFEALEGDPGLGEHFADRKSARTGADNADRIL